jgi:peptidyl-prolyl cis-trans isomerase C
MKKWLILPLILFALLSCSKKEQGKPLATVDGEIITMAEFSSELDKIPTNMKMLVVSQSGKRNFLDRLIVKRLLLKEANKENIEKDKEFQDRLQDIREQLVIESLLKRKVQLNLNVTDADLKKFYDTNRDQFKRDREIETSQIVLKTEQEAKEIQARLIKGETFEDLARTYSIDPSAKATGGKIGYHPKGTLIPEYEEAAFKLARVGQLSPIVKTQLGFHIIKLEGTKAPSFVPFDEVKEFIKQKMGQEKQAEVLEKYIGELKQKAKITINEDLLNEEKKDTGAPAVEPAGAGPAKTDAPKVEPSKQEAQNPPAKDTKEGADSK